MLSITINQVLWLAELPSCTCLVYDAFSVLIKTFWKIGLLVKGETHWFNAINPLTLIDVLSIPIAVYRFQWSLWLPLLFLFVYSNVTGPQVWGNALHALKCLQNTHVRTAYLTTARAKCELAVNSQPFLHRLRQKDQTTTRPNFHNNKYNPREDIAN